MKTTRLEGYIQSIQENYPDLLIHDTSLNNQEGQSNVLLIVNQQLVFRFPKFEAGLVALRREVSLLKQLQSLLPLPIPDPEFVSRNTNTIGKTFMGYQKINGEPLWRSRFQTIKDQQILKHLAAQLAAFLRELHAVPIEHLELDLPINDLPGEWENLYNEIRLFLFSKMRADAHQSVSRHFETFLNQVANHPFIPTLRHGDFGSGNILYDQETESISGIIDFGSAGLGDPAVDIAAAMTFGESFFSNYYASYPDIEALVERAKFYKGTFALQEALYGLKSGDLQAFERGIAPYT
jgi:aminoglycoside 2''-phosphotransferase